jgi:hypothetical protein
MRGAGQPADLVTMAQPNLDLPDGDDLVLVVRSLQGTPTCQR